MRKSSKSRVLPVRLPNEVADEVEERAKQPNVTRNDVIVDGLRRGLGLEKEEQPE